MILIRKTRPIQDIPIRTFDEVELTNTTIFAYSEFNCVYVLSRISDKPMTQYSFLPMTLSAGKHEGASIKDSIDQALNAGLYVYAFEDFKDFMDNWYKM